MFRREDYQQVARGFLMGGADIIPGVSGGTVALILGIYNRLVRAISHFDLTLLDHLRKGEWSKAMAHVDFRFLFTLGIGIASGILGLASLMHHLLEDQEYITIHSVHSAEKMVRLNVGTAHGGLPVGTECQVYRKNPQSDQFEIVARLSIESYEDSEQTTGMRTAVAKPVGDSSLDSIQVTDIVSHPSTRRPLTLAAFFGMILASGFLVARMIERWSPSRWIAVIAGAVASYWLVGQFPVAPMEGNLYLFLCGMLAICAMILPGISGAYILLILGVYADVTGLLRDVLHRQATQETGISILVFATGCGIGLISFSKLLNRLLGRHEQATMAVLCGIMLGSLRKIWPFKRDLTPDAISFSEKLFVNSWPDSLDGHVLLTFALMIVSAGLVLFLDFLTAGHEHHPLQSSAKSDSPADEETPHSGP
ncbi:MAG: hypothetical protein Tsb009_02850 [Planctomycetaceae bacterium]